jgi:hypothetical protein
MDSLRKQPLHGFAFMLPASGIPGELDDPE